LELRRIDGLFAVEQHRRAGRVGAREGSSCLQVQAVAELRLNDFEPQWPKELREAVDPLGVGTCGLPDVDGLADPEDVAAIEVPGVDPVQLEVRRQASGRGFNLADARCRPGPRDDRVTVQQQRGVLDEDRIGILREFR